MDRHPRMSAIALTREVRAVFGASRHVVIARLDRAIPYSAATAIMRKAAAHWITRLRG